MPDLSASTAPPTRLRLVTALARLSWLVPLCVMAIVGFSEEGGRLLGLSGHALGLAATVGAAAGLALGMSALLGLRHDAEQVSARRHALLGTGAGLFLLLLTQVASLAGAIAGRDAERELSDAAVSALHDFPGWNGVGVAGAVRLSANGVDSRSKLAKLLLAPFDGAYEVVLVGIDNRSGSAAVRFEPDATRVIHANGRVTRPVPRAEMRAHLQHGQEEALAAHLAPYRVDAGSRLDNGLLLLSSRDSLEDVRAIEVRIDGKPALIRGRYFTLAEKRAIDAARRKQR